MVDGVGVQQALLTSDPVALFRLLAEARDADSFFEMLRAGLPQLLPATRVDILATGQGDGDPVLLTVGGDLSRPTPGATSTAVSYGDWLRRQGYAMVAPLPLTAGGQPFGWLILARPRRPFEPDILILAGQLAALIGMRLLHEQTMEDLVGRESYVEQLELRLRQTDETRLRAMLAAGAAHDIGNLLSLVLGHAQLLQQDAPPSAQPDLNMIIQAARDGTYLLRRINAHTTQAPFPTTVPAALPAAAVRDAITLTRPFWERRADIRIKTALPPSSPVRAHPVELREVLVNLILNAIDAMPQGGTLTLQLRSEGGRVQIDVHDTGQGIVQPEHDDVFQPFVTTRDDGSGLGLSVSRAIVENYGGTLVARSGRGRGATFTVELAMVVGLDETPPLERALPPSG